MFEAVTTALEPYALALVVFAGLILAGRIPITDNVIVGIATTFIGVALIIVHVIKQVKEKKQPKQGK